MARIIVKFSTNSSMKASQSELRNYMDIISVSNLVNYTYGVVQDTELQTAIISIKNVEGVIDVTDDSNISIQSSSSLRSQLDRINTGLPPTTISLTGSYTIADALTQHNLSISHENGLTGKGIKIAICDTGVDTSNPMLGNNKVIDRLVLEETNTDVLDPVGHGTWVASAAAGNEITHPDYGILHGVAPDASILDIVVFNENGNGTTMSTIQGFEAAIEMGADIISFSGGGNFGSESELSEITEKIFLDYGVLVVAAAGNQGTISTINPPSSNLYSVSVGAIDQFNSRAPFSSIGPASSLVKPDICASGVNIISGCSGKLDMTKDGFEPLSGTSMATPIIAGTFALRKEYEQFLRFDDMILLDRSKIESQLAHSGINPTKDIYTGWGSINIDNFVLTPTSEVPQIQIATIKPSSYVPNTESISTEVKILGGMALLWMFL